MKKEILLRLENVSANYGELKVLNDVSFDLDEGEIVGLMGPNGAGKSTILKAIFGLVPLKSGSLLWHEEKIIPVPNQMAERGVSFVPQGRRVFQNLSAKENLEIGAYLVRNKKEIKERISEVLDLFPVLKEKLKDPSGTLSGGQQQMLAIARGLMTDPKVLLLDEPSLGLSPKLVKEVFAKIKEINEKRKTAIVIVEHNIKSVLEIIKRVYVLDKGSVVKIAEPSHIIKDRILEKVFLGHN